MCRVCYRQFSPPARSLSSLQSGVVARPTRVAVLTPAAQTLRKLDAPTQVRASYGRASPAPSARGLALVTRLALRPLHAGAASRQGTLAAPLRPRAPAGGLRDAAGPEGLEG